jgi:hypothetical protein
VIRKFGLIGLIAIHLPNSLLVVSIRIYILTKLFVGLIPWFLLDYPDRFIPVLSFYSAFGVEHTSVLRTVMS